MLRKVYIQALKELPESFRQRNEEAGEFGIILATYLLIDTTKELRRC